MRPTTPRTSLVGRTFGASARFFIDIPTMLKMFSKCDSWLPQRNMSRLGIAAISLLLDCKKSFAFVADNHH
jgi:hypothetical protein